MLPLFCQFFGRIYVRVEAYLRVMREAVHPQGAHVGGGRLLFRCRTFHTYWDSFGNATWMCGRHCGSEYIAPIEGCSPGHLHLQKLTK